jgi:hypothetical protein
MAKLSKIGTYLPTVTTSNRLEGRPRTVDFDRAFKAEVRDALWLVSKQWQMGEFIGDDVARAACVACIDVPVERLA